MGWAYDEKFTVYSNTFQDEAVSYNDVSIFVLWCNLCGWEPFCLMAFDV